MERPPPLLEPVLCAPPVAVEVPRLPVVGPLSTVVGAAVSMEVEVTVRVDSTVIVVCALLKRVLVTMEVRIVFEVVVRSTVLVRVARTVESAPAEPETVTTTVTRARFSMTPYFRRSFASAAGVI